VVHDERSQHSCPSQDIAAYLDGELMPARELELEMHLASCSVCHSELNSQKQFLRGLESTLRAEGGIDLPADFTRHLVVNAESSVSGLRRPRERFNAIFICAGLGLFALLAVGADAVAGVPGVVAQAASIAGIVGHMIYSVLLGAAIIVRSLAAQVEPNAAGSVIALLALALGALWLATRKIVRIRRV
jgi:anti-sigma factor RsiW